MDLAKRIGMNIRKIRKSQNLTIDELAEKCDFQAPYLSDVERGERNITLQTLTKILDALKIDASSVIIPDFNTNTATLNTKTELIQLLVTILEEKNEDDVRMLINIANEVFERLYSK